MLLCTMSAYSCDTHVGAHEHPHQLVFHIREVDHFVLPHVGVWLQTVWILVRFEPTTFWLWVRCTNHYLTEPLNDHTDFANTPKSSHEPYNKQGIFLFMFMLIMWHSLQFWVVIVKTASVLVIISFIMVWKMNILLDKSQYVHDATQYQPLKTNNTGIAFANHHQLNAAMVSCFQHWHGTPATGRWMGQMVLSRNHYQWWENTLIR
jgi:hypothetical protein